MTRYVNPIRIAKLTRWSGAEWATPIGSQQVTSVHSVAAVTTDPRNTAADRGITETYPVWGGAARVDWMEAPGIKHAETIMSSPVATIRESASLGMAVATFKALPFSRIVVLSDDQRPVGVLTRAAVFNSKVASLDSEHRSIPNLIIQKVATVHGSASPVECADAMLNRLNQNNEVVIVVDEHGRARGIVTKADLLRVNAVRPSFSLYA